MKKGKKYLWAIVVMTAMLFSCGEPVVMDAPSSALLSLDKVCDYQAQTSHKMREVKKWYEQHLKNNKEEIHIKVKGASGEDYYLAYPTPIVKSPDVLSINDAKVAGRGVIVNHIRIISHLERQVKRKNKKWKNKEIEAQNCYKISQNCLSCARKA